MCFRVRCRVKRSHICLISISLCSLSMATARSLCSNRLPGKIQRLCPSNIVLLFAGLCNSFVLNTRDYWLAGWPKTLTLGIPGVGEVLFCHATPRDENEIFTRLTPEEHLFLPVFEALNVSAAVCGHTHRQFDRTVGTVRVGNAGIGGRPLFVSKQFV